jgi:hypothetical protein
VPEAQGGGGTTVIAAARLPALTFEPSFTMKSSGSEPWPITLALALLGQVSASSALNSTLALPCTSTSAPAQSIRSSAGTSIKRVEAAKNTIWTTGCKSWYLDDRGVPTSWPWGFGRFRAEMAKPRFEAYDQRS